MHGKNKKAESCYAVMYLGLRRWVSSHATDLGMNKRLSIKCLGLDQRIVPAALQQAQLHGHAQHTPTPAVS
jgi:hypothetical protein